MNTALNKTLAAVPDDTKVYVSVLYCPAMRSTNGISPATNTPEPMLNLLYLYYRASLLRD